MIKPADLVTRPDFRAGPLIVSPGRRLLESGDRRSSLEPVVMKVLISLLDAKGEVVTRDELFEKAWGGAMVGDDSLNRAIGQVRKMLGEVTPDCFALETIPRTGYRLTGAVAGTPPQRRVSRRLALGSGAAAICASVVGLGLWASRSGQDHRFDELVRRGQDALEYGDGSDQAVGVLEEAVRIRPDSPAAHGLLAYALMNSHGTGSKGALSETVDAAKNAVGISLRSDPRNPFAALALIQLQRTTLDLAGTEDGLRRILQTSPDNILAMRDLWEMLQSAGLSRSGLALVDKAIAIKPLAASVNFPLAQFLWIVGRTAEADRIVDRAMQLWPNHRYVRFARFTIFAFTGRPLAALAMLDDPAVRPQSFSPSSLALWRTSLSALDNPSGANVERARIANLAATKSEPKLASQAAMTLSALGEVDAAFDIANDLFVFRQPSAKSANDQRQPAANSTAWRFAPWLFTPPASALRSDRRFAALTEAIGLDAYWQARGVRPDFETAS